MKFSVSFIRSFVPGIQSKKQLMDALTLHAFEAEDAGGDAIEVKLLNRSGDAASHWGVAREAAAALRLRHSVPNIPISRPLSAERSPKGALPFSIEIREQDLCTRYTARYFDDISWRSSGAAIARTLRTCGLRPISAVVDIMNYVMLETGQPLHAFDFDKIEGRTLVVRRAKRGEFITTLDGARYELSPDMLVADAKKPLAIAGVKGGIEAGVSKTTKRVIIEAATFDPVSIYRTSKTLKLQTDASFRFSHNLHPAFAAIGLERATSLLKREMRASAGAVFDSLRKPLVPRTVLFDSERFRKLTGIALSFREAVEYLSRLGFVHKGQRSGTVSVFEIPLVRQDIEDTADLAEELIRLVGYEQLVAIPPRVALEPAETDESILVKTKVRGMFAGLGFDELYSRSLVSSSDLQSIGADHGVVELENPLSSDFQYLRPSLAPNLLRAAEGNGRFFNSVAVFEIGRVFAKTAGALSERTCVSAVSARKSGESFFFLKGVTERFLRGMGITDYHFSLDIGSLKPVFPVGHIIPETLVWIVSERRPIGYLGDVRVERGWRTALIEIDLDALASLSAGEREYAPLPKYPAMMRDVSIFVSSNVRIGDIIEAIQQSNHSLIQDVDLIDEYAGKEWADEQSITLRIVFQAKNRTLTTEEVDREMQRITALLSERFHAKTR